MVADCGARLIVADATTDRRCPVGGDRARGGAAGADEELRARAVVPRLVALDTAPAAGRGRLRRAARRRAAAAAAGAGPRVAGRAALHLGHLAVAARRDAQPPRAARQHRAGAPGSSRRWSAPTTSCTACCRCSTSTGSTPCSARCCTSRRRSVVADALRPRGRAGRHRPLRRHRGAGRARRCWPTGARSTTLAERLAGVRTLMSGSAPLSPELVEEFTARTGITVHQGYGLTEAAPVVTSTLCSARGQAGLGRLGAARRLASGCVDETGRRAGGGGPGGDPGRRRQPLRRLLAGRRGRPGGRLAGHRRRRLPRRGRRPVPRRPAQGARHRLRLQRLPERDRGGRSPRSTGCSRPRSSACPTS